MTDNTYTPFDGTYTLGETETQYLIRKINRQEKLIDQMRKHAKEDQAALDRCRDMIERLAVALKDTGHTDIGLITEASIYLNILTYGEKVNPVTYPNYKNHAEDHLIPFLKSRDPNWGKP